ncbi:MAG: hypothetical protein IKZ60_05770 [Bacteroidales bacterium]|nr:hypothetical protein [Bacteroidales bacterium]
MKKILFVAFAFVAALAFFSCTKEDASITNTLKYDGKTYKVDFMSYVNPDNTFDSDIHFLEESDLEQAWSMMWAVGKVGSFTLPAKEEDFLLTKNTYPNYEIEFKSGTAKSWVDDNNHLCLVVDGVTTDNKKLKLSVKSTNE